MVVLFLTIFFLADFFDLAALLLLAIEGCEINLDNLDLSRADLFGWMSFTFAALSRAEKTACKFLGELSLLAFLIKVFRALPRDLFRAVLTRSFLIFFMAERNIGMKRMLT